MQGKSAYPAECTPILVCKYMGWSAEDYETAPAEWVDDILTMMAKEAGAAKAQRSAMEAEARRAGRRR